MHSSRGLLADNGAAAQAGWLHSQAMDEQGRSAAKAAREEQPPAAATGWRPELARLSHLAASEEQPPAPAASAAPPAWVRSKGRGEFANFAAVAASGKQPMPAATESTESDSEDDDDEMAPGDWDDILAVWMTAVGLPNLESGRPAASGTSESSDEDEDLPGTCLHYMQHQPCSTSAAASACLCFVGCSSGCMHGIHLVLRNVAARVAAECWLKQRRNMPAPNMLHAI